MFSITWLVNRQIGYKSKTDGANVIIIIYFFPFQSLIFNPYLNLELCQQTENRANSSASFTLYVLHFYIIYLHYN